MASPQVFTRTVDLSQRVAGFNGVIGAMVVPALKGPIDEPILVTNDTQFLDTFTPDQTIKVGYDISHYSALTFLESSDRLYVMRAQNGALYGGAVIKPATVSEQHAALGTGLADPSAYTFQAITETAEAEVFTVTTVADVAGSLNSKHFVIAGGSHYVWINVDSTGIDPKLVDKTGIEVAISAGDTANDVATAINSAASTALSGSWTTGAATNVVTFTADATGVFVDAYDVNSGFTIATTTQGAAAISTEELFVLHAANPGAWNNGIYFKITNYTDNPDRVQVAGAFLLEIFTAANLNLPVESHILSRDPAAKDGFGSNIYIEEALNASDYVRAVDNVTVDSAILPKTNLSVIQLDNGSDGSSVTDAHMLTAVQQFESVDNYQITILMDGGWATPAYQKELLNICENRKDCYAIVSTPYAKEAASAYVNEIIDYRKNILNANSSFGGIYTGWAKVFDRFNDRNLFIDPSGFVGGAVSFSALNYEIWYPPAGFRRGLVNALDLRRRYTKGERDTLYDAGVNPLRFAPGKGIAIFGQKTLQTSPTALDRANVRLLLIVMQPAITATLEDFIFEFNDVATRNAVKGIIETYMDSVKAARGVQDYLVVCNETNNTPAVIDNNTLVVDVYIKPNRAAEFIRFTTALTPTGVNFSDVLGSF